MTWNYGPGSVTIDGRKFSLVSRPAAEAMCRRVLVQEEVTIPPRTEMILKGQYCVPGRASMTRRPCTWALEPCAVRKGVYVASAVMPSRGDNLPVYVANTTEKPVTLRQGCEVADAVPVDCRLAEAAPDERPSVGAALKKQLGGAQSQVTAEDDEVGENLEHLVPLVEAVSTQVGDADKARLWALLQKYKSVFSRSEYDLGQTNLVEHEIHTGDARPVKQALR